MKLFLIIFIITFIFNLNLKAETLEELADEINKVKQEITNLKDTDIKEAIKVDSVIIEFDQVIDFVNNQVSSGNIDVAISSLNIVENIL